MKEVLYYPNFYIENERWLKFALLYLGNVVTIVPSNASEIPLSKNQEIVLKETDIFSTHSPSSDEIKEATADIGDLISRVKTNPFLNNDSNNWRNLDSEFMEIYFGKMVHNFQDVLLENKWAKRTSNGLIINSDLANAYMTLLANSISSNRSISTISDKNAKIEYDRVNRMIYSKPNVKFRSNLENVKTLKSNIEISLPKNIDNIPIERIIEFRNSPQNKRSLNEFHKALELINSINAKTPENYIVDAKERLIDAKGKYMSNLGVCFSIIAMPAISMYQLIDGDSSNLDFLKDVLGMSVFPEPKVVYGQIKGFSSSAKAISYLTEIEGFK
ncbi:hypothetical protein [Exiguobacterium mexicanum]|uniref:hypothetical protein n=1 Tax=Exiguobacterium mexicanum TaxID=340146 RepID=UPI00110D44F3|nr:hypothetical protein [Exiguobacterium mexicanum]